MGYTRLPFVTPPLPSSRWQPFALPVFAMALLAGGRALYVVVVGQPMFHRRALILGAVWAGQTIAQALAEHGNGTYHLVGFVDDDPEKLGTTVTWGDGRTTAQGDKETRGTTDEGRGRPGETQTRKESGDAVNVPTFQRDNVLTPKVLGDRHALPTLISERDVNTLVLAITDEVDGELLGVLTDSMAQGVDVVPMPMLFEDLTGRVPVEHVGENWYVAMPLRPPSCSALWPVVKRVFDVVSAGLGAICLGLALPFIAAAIYLDSPGRIFYTQERVGKGGKRFRVLKFRSMVPNAEEQGEARWAEEDDERVTRLGRVLRRTHVDEFPQFFNILKGEMSAVGPRPERPAFVAELVEEIPFYNVRHAVKPGMAGWGLVKQGYGSSMEDARLKLQYDLYYIKHQSLWLDTVILLKTIIDTLTLGGR